MAKVEIDKRAFNRSVRRAFAKANLEWAKDSDSEMRANKWKWLNPPSPRDIVDTGELVESRTLEPGNSGRKYTHKWDADHGIIVQKGYVQVTNEGEYKVYLARDWVKSTNRKKSWKKRLKDNIKL